MTTGDVAMLALTVGHDAIDGTRRARLKPLQKALALAREHASVARREARLDEAAGHDGMIQWTEHITWRRAGAEILRALRTARRQT